MHALATATLLPAGVVSAVGLLSSDGPYWLMRQEPFGTFPKAVETEKSWDEASTRAKAFHAEMVESYEKWMRGTKRERCLADAAEATRQGWDGMARDLVLEGKAWAFEPAPLKGVPVLMWHGEHDEDVQPAAAQFLAKRLGVDLHLFERETHTLIRRRWAECLGELVAAAADCQQ